MKITIKTLGKLPTGFYKVVNNEGFVEDVFQKKPLDRFVFLENTLMYDVVEAHNYLQEFSNNVFDWKILPVEEPENSEYAGNSGSGQSAGIDLMKDQAITSIWEIWEKVNEVIKTVNQLSKPSETTKEHPLTNKEIDEICNYLIFFRKSPSFTIYSLIDKLKRMKV